MLPTAFTGRFYPVIIKTQIAAEVNFGAGNNALIPVNPLFAVCFDTEAISGVQPASAAEMPVFDRICLDSAGWISPHTARSDTD